MDLIFKAKPSSLMKPDPKPIHRVVVMGAQGEVADMATAGAVEAVASINAGKHRRFAYI